MARFDLALGPEEFGKLTIAQFEALLGRKQEAHKHDFLIAGVISSTIINSNPWRGKEVKPAKATDFVPDYGKTGAPQRQTAQEHLEILRSVAAALNRKGKKKIKRVAK